MTALDNTCSPSASRAANCWPPIVDGKMVLTPAQLTLLIEAMDWRRTVAADVPRRPMAVG